MSLVTGLVLAVLSVPAHRSDPAYRSGRSGDNLAWLAGAPFEDTAAALRLILAGVTDRYPRIRFIVPHLGGTIPFLLARVTRKSATEITGGLRSMYYNTVSGSSDALTSACHAFGADRLLFGTDYLLQRTGVRHHLGYLGESELNADELRQVKDGTAAALLLPGHPAARTQESPAAHARKRHGRSGRTREPLNPAGRPGRPRVRW